jgi:hypothetical protein
VALDKDSQGVYYQDGAIIRRTSAAAAAASEPAGLPSLLTQLLEGVESGLQLKATVDESLEDIIKFERSNPSDAQLWQGAREAMDLLDMGPEVKLRNPSLSDCAVLLPGGDTAMCLLSACGFGDAAAGRILGVAQQIATLLGLDTLEVAAEKSCVFRLTLLQDAHDSLTREQQLLRSRVGNADDLLFLRDVREVYLQKIREWNEICDAQRDALLEVARSSVDQGCRHDAKKLGIQHGPYPIADYVDPRDQNYRCAISNLPLGTSGFLRISGNRKRRAPGHCPTNIEWTAVMWNTHGNTAVNEQDSMNIQRLVELALALISAHIALTPLEELALKQMQMQTH